jgi:hypothetical protein
MSDAEEETTSAGQIQDRLPTSRLLADLLAEVEQNKDRAEAEAEWRRREARGTHLTGARLELQQRNGTVHHVRLHNVNSEGLCVVCPRKFRQFDVVSLRRSGDSGPHELFKIVHVTSTVGGFKLGMVRDGN